MTNWIISSSILILGVILLRFFLKGKISLRLQYGLWALVMIRLLIPFSIGETVISIGNWLEQVEDTKEAQELMEFSETKLPSMSYTAAYDEVADIYAQKGIDIAGIPEYRFVETVEYEIMETMTRDGKTLAEMLQLLWLCGVVAVAFAFFVSNLYFANKLKKNRTVFRSNKLPIYISDLVDTPCLYGLFHPAIYITTEVAKDDTSLRHVIEHEKTHYMHKDYIWSVLRVFCLALHWYNPLVWCAAVLSRNDAELACDEATILRLGEAERAAYGRTLIGLTCEKRPAMLLTATTMTSSGKSIKERITLIAKKPKMAAVTFALVLFVAVVAVGCTFTGAEDKYDNFSEWTKLLDRSEIAYMQASQYYGLDEISYDMSTREQEVVLQLLQAVPEEKCFRRKLTVEEYDSYRLAITIQPEADTYQTLVLKCLVDGTILVSYDTAMGNFAGNEPDNISLIIESEKLWSYIVDVIETKGKVQVSPTAEIDDVFEMTGVARISLHMKDKGEINAYSVLANQYPHKRLIAIFNSFSWMRVENPNLSTSEFWISLESTDGTEKITFWDINHGIVECSWDGGQPIYWELNVKQPNDAEIQLIPFFQSVRHIFDNLEVEMLNLSFEENGDAAKAARTFAYEIYGNHYMNLSPGNSYGFDEYEVVKLEIDEISEDGTQVEAWLTYAFVPWDINSVSIWAGNTDYATGEYEGMLWANCRFTLEKAEDGVWRCIGVGTSAVTE